MIVTFHSLPQSLVFLLAFCKKKVHLISASAVGHTMQFYLQNLGFYLILCFALLKSIHGFHSVDKFEEDENEYSNITLDNGGRSSRGFPFLAVIRLQSTICSFNGQVGICKTRKSCENGGGMVFGDSCGNGYGVCCMQTASCSTSNSGQPVRVTSSGTHIVNPRMYTPPLQCQFAIPRKAGVCQVRLDFVQFSMSDPNMVGDCDTDSMTITGTVNLPNFVTCGNNSGQHLYLQYGSSDTIMINLILKSASMSYDLLATFIDCPNSNGVNKKKKTGRTLQSGNNKNSNNMNTNNNDNNDVTLELAPAGCAQYFTRPSDVVRSFNYHAIATSNGPNTYQINNEQYTVCVKSPSGARRITWSVCSAGDVFFISGGLPEAQPPIRPCQTDYVDIPGSDEGRYCGASFPQSVTSIARPFMMYVNFNDNEDPIANSPLDPTTGCCAGFCTCFVGGIVTPPGGPCSEADPTSQCFPNQFILDRTDFFNAGFCLRYSIS